MEERCQREIVELHRFFQDWFNAELEETDAAFSRFASVVGSGFVIVTPDGDLVERDALIEGLRAAYGAWRDGDGNASRIRIENVRVHHAEGDLALLTYEEWQEVRGSTRARLSTVLLRNRDGMPNGLEWLHVHEVWMPH